ncbi:MAG: phosphate ABC transporter ATP-binding protein PstB [Pseudomonadales bacterium]|nr:phosphate ABC transporter ATP-binding protein PstB [Pseudomonadales bacterium]MDG1443809.1 phosphate ABC transporter ATP-binding protein PstB [Pseudomonadales bacterium]
MMTNQNCAQNLELVSGQLFTDEVILDIDDVTISYSGNPAVKSVSFPIAKNKITSIIGPSGCGKSTLLRSINRMNDFVEGVTVQGQLSYCGHDVYSSEIDPVEVRRNIGMVFQKPNPFPKTIYKNISWGPVINGYKGSTDELVEKSLRQAALWEEVKDRLHESALSLSGGQQQRLCIARALAMEPDILLMDEPCSALDPISTSHIEDLLFELKARYTIVIVTHNMQQAARISDYTAFLEMGDLIEFGVTDQLFTRPSQRRTEEYVTGRFG